MARPPRIAILVGSLRDASLNLRLARALAALMGPRAQCEFVPIGQLPHYDEDEDQEPGEAVVAFRRTIAAADAFVFVTPEYNRSVPGVLKNAIDQGSRPRVASAWKDRPAGVIGASPGALGTCMAQQHLRNILACLDVHVMGQPEAYVQVRPGAIDDDGAVLDAQLQPFLATWCDALLRWIDRFPRTASA